MTPDAKGSTPSVAVRVVAAQVLPLETCVSLADV